MIPGVKESIKSMEQAIWRYEKIADTLLFLTTVDERQSTLRDTLMHIKKDIELLGDEELGSLCQRLVEGRCNSAKYGQVLKTEHGAFMLKLVNLADECITDMNEANIELKAALGLDASRGIWGPKGWKEPCT